MLVLALQDHINMRGHNFEPQPVQILITHATTCLLPHQPTPYIIKTTPQALCTGLLNTIPQHSSSHVHMHFTNITIQKLSPNTILGTSPPEMYHSEQALRREDRVHLCRLRCGHHIALATNQKRIHDSVDEVTHREVFSCIYH